MALSTYTSTQTVQTGDVQNGPCGGACQTTTGKLIFLYTPSAAHAGSGSIAVRTATSEANANAGTFTSAATIAAEDATYYYSAGGATVIRSGVNAGRVWLAYNRVTVASGPRTLNVQFKYSDDDGVTWSSAINVSGVGNGDGSAYGLSGHATAGRIVEVPTTAGQTLLLPVWSYDGSNTKGYARLLHSTDGGATWAIKSTIVSYNASYDTSEHHIAVVILPSGATRLLCSIVYLGASATIETCYSDDLGATWSAMSTAITSATASPAMLQLTDGSVVMLYRNLASSENTWLARSTDYGASFPSGGRQVVDSSHRMRYGNWVSLLSGRLGLCYATEASSTSAGVYWLPYISPLPARKRVGSRRGLSVWA